MGVLLCIVLALIWAFIGVLLWKLGKASESEDFSPDDRFALYQRPEDVEYRMAFDQVIEEMTERLNRHTPSDE